ncbi:TPR-like protein [Serendipita vermifera]|nr:TPR-like protein [Serendipita vermifera]
MSVTATNGLRIISFDSSGLRTISQLEVLRNIMHRIQCDTFPEDPDKTILPCEYFDLMGGSDTGGLIALLFVKCRMSVDEVLDAFYEICDKVYMDTCIDADERSGRLRQCLEDILSSKELPLTLKLGQDKRVTTATKCAGFVVATSKEGLDQAILRTYAIRAYPSIDLTFIEAALATCAAEPSFLPVKMGSRLRQQTYISGNISGVNPSKQLLSEAYALFGGSGRLACFLSLGPGPIDILSMYPDGSSNETERTRLLQAAIVDHKKVEHEIATKIGDSGVYFRFSAAHFLQGKENDKDLGSILTKTNAYLRDVEISRKIDACVECCRLKRGLITLDQLESTRRKNPVYKDFPAPTKHFVTRSEPWQMMTNNLVEKVPSGIGQKVMVISGMGGCGKTQLVAQFMKEYRSKFRYAFFIDGSSRESIEVDIINSVQSLGEDHSPITVEDALDFFRNPHHAQWVLVYDNVDDTSLKIANYLPECQYGSVIITTRNHLIGQLASHKDLHIKLGPMSDEEAIDSIYKSAELEKSEDSRSSMASIAAELGNLPVALIQAGSYLLRTMCTPSEYLKKLQAHKAELMKKSTGDREDRSTYAAFELSYQRLSSSTRKFLHILSHMHYNDFPLDLIAHAAQHKFRVRLFSFENDEEYERGIDLLSDIFSGSGESVDLALDSIITALQNYSLATFYRTSVGLLLRIHLLDHLYLGHTHPSNDQKIYKAAAARLVVHASTYKQIQVYAVPHIMSLTHGSSIQQISLDDLGAFATILVRVQHVETAGDIWKKICQELTIRDPVNPNSPKNAIGTWFREKHPWDNLELLLSAPSGHNQYIDLVYSLQNTNTLQALANYATTYRMRKKYDTAERLLNCVVSKMCEEHGPNEETLKAQGELALIYQMQQQYSESQKLQEKVLSMLQKRLGEDHPDTLGAMANLAITHRFLGNYNDAMKLQEKIIEINRVQLGDSHWETLKSTMNLAKTLHAQGQYVSARRLQEKVWNERTAQLGERHLKTLDAMAHLAITYRSQDDYSSAEAMQVYVLNQRKIQLGECHLSTLEAMDQLGITYHLQGRYPIAAQMQKQVMEERTRRLGETHTDTLRAMISLSITFRSQNRHTEAISMQERVLEIRKKSLGYLHPETLESMTNLSITYCQSHRYSQAGELQYKVCYAKSRRCGSSHPETLKAQLNLADTYHCMGENGKAMNLQREVVEARTRLYGPDHSETLDAISRLALTYRSTRDFSTCETLQMRVLDERKKQLGEDHQIVQRAMAQLAKTYKLQHRYDEAVQLFSHVFNWRVQNLGRTHLDTIACLEELLSLHEIKYNYRDALELLITLLEALESHPEDQDIGVWRSRFVALFEIWFKGDVDITPGTESIFDMHRKIVINGADTRTSENTPGHVPYLNRSDDKDGPQTSQGDLKNISLPSKRPNPYFSRPNGKIGKKVKKVVRSRDEMSGDERSGESSSDDISPNGSNSSLDSVVTAKWG